MTKARTQRYTTRPSIPAALRGRYAKVIAVLCGAETITGASSELGVSRVQMQTIVHRAEEAIIASLAPRRSGPPPQRSKRERELEKENAQLRSAVARAERRAATLERLTQTAGELIREARRSRTRGARSSGSRRGSTAKRSAERDPDPAKSRERELEIRREVTHQRRRGDRAGDPRQRRARCGGGRSLTSGTRERA